MDDAAARPVEITRIRPGDETAQVLTLQGGGWAVQPQPCAQCPWRVDQTGAFPPAAFEHSAETAYDMAQSTFACHMAGHVAPRVCAGFLLSTGAAHNLTVRLRLMDRRFRWDQVADGGHQLHPDYRAMAVANGVPPDHPRLRPCR